MPATKERRELVSALVRWHEVRDDTVKAHNPLARDSEVITPFINLTDAQTVATNLWNLFSVERTRITVTVADSVGRFSIGDTIEISHPAIGTRSGLIVGVDEDLVTNTATLSLLV